MLVEASLSILRITRLHPCGDSPHKGTKKSMWKRLGLHMNTFSVLLFLSWGNETGVEVYWGEGGGFSIFSVFGLLGRSQLPLLSTKATGNVRREAFLVDM